MITARFDLNMGGLDQVNPADLWNDPKTLLMWIMHRAITERASDIQIDKCGGQLRVRLCIDGHLNTFLMGEDVTDRLGAVIKSAANMNIAEKRQPQDGRFSVQFFNRAVDFRVCALPTVEGYEDFALRLIDDNVGLLSLDDLQLTPQQLQTLRQGITRSHGIILATGPTGCGKTTTLYAMLQAINDGSKKIQTIEDPVELRIDGVSQAQVRGDIDLTFVNLLRSILRSTPDVIMVGEIRDLETAKVAVSAANTGHLVLSTVHTNDSLSAINRLVEFGVPSYLVGQSLIMVMAQRLVRLLCSCSQEHPMQEEEKELFEKSGFRINSQHAPLIRSACGCVNCRNTGYKHRVVVMEIAKVTPGLRELVKRHADYLELLAEVRRHGFSTLYQECLLKVLRGLTALAEIEKFQLAFNEF
ncbi:MAG: GspE/PulE family protein [bacterium]